MEKGGLQFKAHKRIPLLVTSKKKKEKEGEEEEARRRYKVSIIGGTIINCRGHQSGQPDVANIIVVTLSFLNTNIKIIGLIIVTTAASVFFDHQTLGAFGGIIGHEWFPTSTLVPIYSVFSFRLHHHWLTPTSSFVLS